MFYIRADANKQIASGHVMRCISIARQIERAGEKCTFIAADEDSRTLIQDNGFSFICLHTDWYNMEGELDKLILLIKENKIEKLLLDSYAVTRLYMEKLSECTKIIYIDDLNRFLYPADTIINYGIQYKNYHYEESYGKEKSNKNTKFLLGCRYIPLRDEFREIEPGKIGKIREILITTGGTDPYNIAGELVQILQGRSYRLHVVSGRMNQNLKALEQLKEQNENMNLYVNTAKMAELMMKCDLAVSAGGTTLYELCACKTPTVSITFADNQIEGAKELARRNIIKYAGDVRNDMADCLEKIVLYIEQMEKDPKARVVMIENMKKLVDGKGAERIAKYCLLK